MDFFRLQVASKVPLVMVDSDVPDPKVRRAYLGTHNYRAGRAAGELIKKAIPEGGNVVISVGKMDVQNAVERRQGVLGIDAQEIKDRTPAGATNLQLGKYRILSTITDDAKESVCQEKAEDLFLKNRDIDAVVGLWAYNPPALLRAKEKTKAKAAIIGFDENEETLLGIEQGKIVGTIVQSPYQFGYDSVKILAALSKKDETVLKKYEGIDAENRIFIPHQVITKENVAEFHAKVNKLLGK